MFLARLRVLLRLFPDRLSHALSASCFPKLSQASVFIPPSSGDSPPLSPFEAGELALNTQLQRECRSRLASDLKVQTPFILATLGGLKWIAPIGYPWDIPENEIKLLQFVARGGFGEVWKAHDLVLRKSQSVVKIIDKKNVFNSTNGVELIEQELRILRNMPPHKSRCDFFRFFESKEKIYFVLKDCGTDLSTLFKNVPLAEVDAKPIFLEMVRAAMNLHALGIVHRDIKPTNFVMDNQGRIRIIDFGYTTLNFNKQSELFGTPGFHVPEVILQTAYTPTLADSWSLGICLYYLLHPKHRLPFGVEWDTNYRERVRNLEYPALANISDSAADLLKKLLSYESERLPVERIQEHQWFQGIETQSTSSDSSSATTEDNVPHEEL